jgi:hypothetical protein
MRRILLVCALVGALVAALAAVPVASAKPVKAQSHVRVIYIHPPNPLLGNPLKRPTAHAASGPYYVADAHTGWECTIQGALAAAGWTFITWGFIPAGLISMGAIAAGAIGTASCQMTGRSIFWLGANGFGPSPGNWCWWQRYRVAHRTEVCVA